MAINLPKIGDLDDKALAALDPYLYWFLASGFKDFERRPGGRFDVMVELKMGKKVSDLASALPDLANHLVLLYGETAAIAYTSATVDVQGLLALLKRPDLVDRVQLAAPLHAPRAEQRTLAASPTTRPSASPSKLERPASSSSTLLAVIDDGCPFAHQMLWSEQAYRLRAIWDQDRSADFASLGQAPTAFGYGAAAERSALLAHMAAHSENGRVNEEACYQSLHYQAALRVRSHGGHTLGMYLQGPRGLGPGVDVPHANTQSDVLFVQLPRDVTNVPAHGARLRAILDGVRWVMSRALPHEKTVRIVVPYGSVVGPHDGSSIFTKALDFLIEEAAKACTTLQVILPSGNDFREGLHWVCDSVDAGGSGQATLRLAAESELPVFVELWLPESGQSYSLSVVNPRGEEVINGSLKNFAAVALSIERADCAVVSTGWRGEAKVLVLLRFSPTLHAVGGGSAQAGDWQITIASVSAVTEPIHAYVSKARGGLGSLKRAHQSKFIDHHSATRARVSSEGTISDAATGGRTIVLGAHKPWKAWVSQGQVGHEVLGLVANAPADYTSSGPASGGARARRPELAMSGPNYSMPSAQSPWLPGFRNAGNRSAATYRMDGTSVAASYFAALEGVEIDSTMSPAQQYPPPTLSTQPYNLVISHAGERERLGLAQLNPIA